MKSYDLIILGAGASGLMLAYELCKKNVKKILIIEHNSEIAMKVKISGGGKCNITNSKVGIDNYLGNAEFIDSVFKQYSNRDLLLFLKNNDIAPKIRSFGQYFCQKSSDEIVQLLKSGSDCAKVWLAEEISTVELTKNREFLVTTDKNTILAKYLVVATGSPAYPQVGGSDIGLKIATLLGHETEKFTPALVGLSLQKDQFWMKELSGISTTVTISVADKKCFGELLFAHRGISGPAVLSASLYWKKGTIEIDFLPNNSIEKLLKEKKKQISTQLGLSKRLTKELLQTINIQDKPVNQLKKDEWEKLNILKSYKISPAGNFGLKKAEACAGGVKTTQIDKTSMESKLHKNLFFIGEVVDVTGELGGYNFQWAFSSAVACATELEKRLNR